MSDLRTVDEATFDELVLRADKPVLVDFWAQWCPPCHQIAPVLAQIGAERNDQLTVLKLNSDENPAISASYRVMALPTLMLFRQRRGDLVRRRRPPEAQAPQGNRRRPARGRLTRSLRGSWAGSRDRAAGPASAVFAEQFDQYSLWGPAT